MCKVNFWQPAVRHKHQPRASINIPRAPAPEWDIRTTRCLSARLARRRIFTRFCRLSSVARLPPQLCPRARILRDRTATTDRQGPIAASVRKGDRACALGSGALLAVVNACTCPPVTSSWCLQPASLDPNNHLLPQWGLCGVPRSKAWPSAGMLKVAKALAPPLCPKHPLLGMPRSPASARPARATVFSHPGGTDGSFGGGHEFHADCRAGLRRRRASRALPTPPPCCLTHTLVCVLAGWLNSTQLNSPQLTSTQSNTLTTPPLPTAAAPPAAARDAVPCWSPHPQHTTTLLNQTPPPFNLEPLGLHVGLLCGLLVVLCCSQNQNAPPGRHDRSSVVSAGGRCCVWTVRSSAFGIQLSPLIKFSIIPPASGSANVCTARTQGNAPPRAPLPRCDC